MQLDSYSVIFLTVCVCKFYLPVVSSAAGGAAEELVENGHFVFFDNKVAVLLFLSNQVARLEVLLVAFSINIWRPLHEKGVEVVNPADAQREMQLF